MTNIITPDDPQKETQNTPEIDPSSFTRREDRAIYHYLRTHHNLEEFEKLVADLEQQVGMEVVCHTQPLDEMLTRQSVLLDAAFRFYISGGASGEISEYNFDKALKCQMQSAGTLNAMRAHRLRKDRGEVYWHEHLSKSNARLLRNRKIIEKDAERSHRSAHDFFTKLSDDDSQT